MKFKSVNEFDTFQFKEAALQSVKLNDTQMTVGIEGAVIRSDNSNNTRFEDMYCAFMELTLDGFSMKRFVEQGYKYYDMDGKLISEVPDRVLEQKEQEAVLNTLSGAYLFRLEKSQDLDGYEMIFDVESDDDDGFAKTYQMDFDFKDSIAGWDRFSGPVNG